MEGHVKALVIGGEALWSENLSFWRKHAPGTRLINEYGPTETVVGCCVYEVPLDVTLSGAVAIGRPIANMRIYLLDAHLQVAPPGVPAEMYIGGSGLARGYLQQPDITAASFIPDPFCAEPGSRLYRTGDLARLLPDGNIEYLGRIDHQVKIRGYRIELGEIENIVSQHQLVKEVAVIVQEHIPGSRRLIAYVVASTEGDESQRTSELRAYVQQQLPEYMVPALFMWLKALPQTQNGKIDRKALLAPDQYIYVSEQAYTAPRNEIEEALVEIWQQVLGIEQVGIYDNFFALGGDLDPEYSSRLTS